MVEFCWKIFNFTHKLKEAYQKCKTLKIQFFKTGSFSAMTKFFELVVSRPFPIS